MANDTIYDYSQANTIDGSTHWLLIQPGTNSVSYNRINRNTFLGVSGQPVDTTTAQSISNKTLGNTNSITVKDNSFTLQDDSDTTKQAVFQLSSITTSTTRTYTLPDASTTLVGASATQTLTNKTLTSPTITGGTYDNGTITVDAIGGHTSANVVTVAGLQINNGVLNTNNSVVTANITDGAVTPAKLQSGTGSGWTYSSYTPTYANFTLGNGSVATYYKQTGKKVHFYGVITLGTTSSVSGQAEISLPVNAAGTVPNFQPIGTCNTFHSATNSYYPGVAWKSDGGQRLRIIVLATPGGAGTYASAAGTSSTIPFTWATNDLIFWDIAYEAA